MVFVKYVSNYKGITFYANRHFLVFPAIFAVFVLSVFLFWQVFGGNLADKHCAIRQKHQQRQKRSGQKWTLKGGQQVLNIRTKNLSNQWIDVTQLVRMAA